MIYDMEIHVEVNGRMLTFYGSPRVHWLAAGMGRAMRQSRVADALAAVNDDHAGNLRRLGA
jgi:hypothetical protein